MYDALSISFGTLLEVYAQASRDSGGTVQGHAGNGAGAEVLRVLCDFPKELAEYLEGKPGECGLI